MRAIKHSGILFILVGIISATVPDLHGQAGISTEGNSYEDIYKKLTYKVDKDRISTGVYYLADGTLQRRVLNWSRPGHKVSSLEEADKWIIKQLSRSGYNLTFDTTMVRAFSRDLSKPLAHQYVTPHKNSPWYIARNIYARKVGSEYPDKLIIIVAHKDSQSWIESPGANDNAIGTCGALELAIVLKDYKPKNTILFIFCNEEHTPWTSVTAAEAIKASGDEVLAVINMDGIGVKGPSQAGQMTNVTRYTTPEGERLADMMDMLNTRHALGLQQTKYLSQRPGDDDGSFINAGFPWAVLNIGSMPYGDPNYHTEDDTADKVDYANARVTVQLTLAALLNLDANGRP
ncbi:MAG: hypothetical protein A2X03_09145 [Bacteroidetes bacterium GWA2_40_15]|nr:MAG: hypothetical protein A2X03_09145 [Bacteroidetes bacterium GWA2_40_15]OFY00504.1 MAG: hypothetical protein A2X06_00155 [Bacteroidetes bacterium GWC2_40_22]HBH82538.1 hypothetical protein [Bacteroidales bacterium]